MPETASEAWRSWRVTAEGVTWRVADPSDEPAMRALIGDTEARIGSQTRPNVFAMPVILALVAEDEAGIIVDAVYVEVVAEIRKVALSRVSFVSIEAIEPHIAAFLRGRGFRQVYIRTLRGFAGRMRDGLVRMGFAWKRKFVTFTREL